MVIYRIFFFRLRADCKKFLKSYKINPTEFFLKILLLRKKLVGLTHVVVNQFFLLNSRG